MGNSSNSEGESQSSEVSPRATRRRFTAAYKRRILKEADAAKERGEQGALLRREGLYSSHLVKWREQELEGLAPQKRGPKPKEKDPRDAQIKKLEREVRRLNVRVERADALVELQKKVSKLMGITLPNEEEEGS